MPSLRPIASFCSLLLCSSIFNTLAVASVDKKMKDESITVPMSVGISQMIKRPLLSNSIQFCNSNSTIKFTANLQVDKNANLTGTHVVQGTGNSKIDKEILKDLRKAKFKPLIKEGQPRAFNFNLSALLHCSMD